MSTPNSLTTDLQTAYAILPLASPRPMALPRESTTGTNGGGFSLDIFLASHNEPGTST